MRVNTRFINSTRGTSSPFFPLSLLFNIFDTVGVLCVGVGGSGWGWEMGVGDGGEWVCWSGVGGRGES